MVSISRRFFPIGETKVVLQMNMRLVIRVDELAVVVEIGEVNERFFRRVLQQSIVEHEDEGPIVRDEIVGALIEVAEVDHRRQFVGLNSFVEQLIEKVNDTGVIAMAGDDDVLDVVQLESEPLQVSDERVIIGDLVDHANRTVDGLHREIVQARVEEVVEQSNQIVETVAAGRGQGR